MEFLFPYPKGSDTPPITVPFFESPTYDHTAPEAFRRFPSRNGYTTLGHSTNLNDDQNSQNLAALMQSWLNFGLLDEIFGHHVDRISLTSTTTDQASSINARRIIDIRIKSDLAERLKMLEETIATQVDSVRLRRWEQISEDIGFAAEMCTRFERIDTTIDSPLIKVCLSVRLLLLLLKRWREDPNDRRTATKEGVNFTPLALSPDLPVVRLLTQRARDSGMCLRTLYGNAQGMTYDVIYYLISLKTSINAALHRKCTKNNCAASSAGMPPRASHRQPNCLCGDKKYINIRDVVRLISKGDIPLVSCVRDSHGETHLQVVKCHASTSYIAISHVWSDQQLCSEDNGLYPCQLNWLTASLDCTPQEVNEGLSAGDIGQRQRKKQKYLFWLDTLCIPNQSEYSDIKQQAIDQMDVIYAGAHHVLVLDRELQQLQVSYQNIIVGRRAKWVLSLASSGPHRSTPR